MKKKIKISTEYGMYNCVFTPDTKGYVVTCPAVEGVVTWGRNLKEGKSMAKEAVELCIEAKVQDNIDRGIASRRFSKKDAHELVLQ